jgi:hypothetical protein
MFYLWVNKINHLIDENLGDFPLTTDRRSQSQKRMRLRLVCAIMLAIVTGATETADVSRDIHARWDTLRRHPKFSSKSARMDAVSPLDATLAFASHPHILVTLLPTMSQSLNATTAHIQTLLELMHWRDPAHALTMAHNLVFADRAIIVLKSSVISARRGNDSMGLVDTLNGLILVADQDGVSLMEFEQDVYAADIHQRVGPDLWNLDVINNPNGFDLSGQYATKFTGDGIRVHILDTGVNIHQYGYHVRY